MVPNIGELRGPSYFLAQLGADGSHEQIHAGWDVFPSPLPGKRRGSKRQRQELFFNPLYARQPCRGARRPGLVRR